MPVVVDTSLALKWVRTEVYTAEAIALRDDYFQQRDTIAAPSLLLYEATNTLFGFARDGFMTWTEAERAIDDVLATVRLQIAPASVAKRALEITRLTSQTYAYDTQFLALAEYLGGDLWTADERFQRAMNRHGFAQVKAIGTYPLPTT